MCHVIIFCPLSVHINYAFSSPLISLTYLVATFLIFFIKFLHTSVILGLWCVVGINFFPLMHLKYMEYTCNLDLQFFSTKITTIKLMCLEYMVQVPRSLSMICGSLLFDLVPCGRTLNSKNCNWVLILVVILSISKSIIIKLEK